MTIGETIQKRRKAMGMSQDELGQKLLVSRQTISLWEKDQTTPTIDNLIRLKEVFNLSVDEILGLDDPTQPVEQQPNETYCFHYAKAELTEIYRLHRRVVCKRSVLPVLLFAFLLLISVVSPNMDTGMVGFCSALFLFTVLVYAKRFRVYKKAWKRNFENISQRTYEYKLFDTHILLYVYRNNEKIREYTCYFTDIEQIQQLDKWLFVYIGGQFFILRKNELKENSAFFSYMYTHPSKTAEIQLPSIWKFLSTLLFVVSLLSIFAAIILVSMLSETNGRFYENMWIFYLFSPLPIASVILGYFLKAKGYKYKKNLIVGFIMTFVLCIYGSFAFIYP